MQTCYGHGAYRRCGKRLRDLTLTVLGLGALSPVLVFTAVLIRFFLGSPVLFRQT